MEYKLALTHTATPPLTLYLFPNYKVDSQKNARKPCNCTLNLLGKVTIRPSPLGRLWISKEHGIDRGQQKESKLTSRGG